MKQFAVKQIAISEIIPYENNPRINEKAVCKVAASIDEFGLQQPIVVDEDMVVIAGHTRLSAAQSPGLPKVPTFMAVFLFYGNVCFPAKAISFIQV